MANATDTLPGINVVQTSGPLFLSYSIQCVLYGALCIQSYLYYLSFPRDSAMTKALVGLLYLTATLQVILKTRDMFVTYAEGFANVKSLDDDLLAWLSVPILDGVVGCAVQIFFSYRAWLLSRSRLLIMLLVALALLQCGAAIATGAMNLHAGTYSKIHSMSGPTTGTAIWMSASAACDLIVAFTLTYHYYRRRSGNKARNAPFAFIVSMLVETGIITAVTAIVQLLLFFGFRNTSFFTAPAIILGMLYANSCMAVLNSRVSINGGREEPDTTDIDISSNAVARHTATGFVKRFVDVAPTALPAPTVQVQKEVWSEGMAMSDMKSRKALPDFPRDEESFPSKPKPF